MRGRTRGRASGTTLLETIIVVAMILVVSSMAMPNVLQGIYNIRLRSSAASVSGLLQSTRMDAVKRNTTLGAFYTTMGSGGAAYVDLDASGSLTPSDRVVQLAGTVRRTTTLPTGVTELTSTQLSFTPDSITNMGNLNFNSRGIPIDGAGLQKGFVYYFTDSRPLGRSGVVAVSVTPAGRIRAWMWNGGAWGN